jgi:hypothetical protein
MMVCSTRLPSQVDGGGAQQHEARAGRMVQDRLPALPGAGATYRHPMPGQAVVVGRLDRKRADHRRALLALHGHRHDERPAARCAVGVIQPRGEPQATQRLHLLHELRNLEELRAKPRQ